MLTNLRDACFVVVQNLAKIGWYAAELLRIFDFQNGGRPPYWIWYDVIANDPRLVFDCPNIVLKLHVDRVYILRDIAVFIFGPSGLKSRPFWGVWGYDGVPLGIGYRRHGSKKTRMIWLPDGRKSFKIGLAVLIQYRRVADTDPATQPATLP